MPSKPIRLRVVPVLGLSLLVAGAAAAQTAVPSLGHGLRGAEVDQMLGPWPVDRLLLPREFFVAAGEPDATALAAPPVTARLHWLLSNSDRLRLPPTLRGVAHNVLFLIDYGVQAMTRITKGLDPHLGRIFEPLEVIGPEEDPWGVPSLASLSFDDDEEPDQPVVPLDLGVTLRLPVLQVDALPAFNPGEPTVDSFWIYLDTGWPADPLASDSGAPADAEPAETAALDVAPPVSRNPPRLVPFLMQSTSLAFLAAVILVPAGCSFAAGTLYGRTRDGPRRRVTLAE